MRFTITRIDGYLRADLYERETADETREFLDALDREASRQDCRHGLISSHQSRAIFRVETFALSGYFRRLASTPGHRLALVADNAPVRAAQQYVETLARQQKLVVRAFASEEEAVRWLREPTRRPS